MSGPIANDQILCTRRGSRAALRSVPIITLKEALLCSNTPIMMQNRPQEFVSLTPQQRFASMTPQQRKRRLRSALQDAIDLADKTDEDAESGTTPSGPQYQNLQ